MKSRKILPIRDGLMSEMKDSIYQADPNCFGYPAYPRDVLGVTGIDLEIRLFVAEKARMWGEDYARYSESLNV